MFCVFFVKFRDLAARNKILRNNAQHGTWVSFSHKYILEDVGSNSLHSRSQDPAARNKIFRNYLPCVRSCDSSV